MSLRRLLLVTIALGIAPLGGDLLAQSAQRRNPVGPGAPPTTRLAAAITVEDAAVLANGWALLADGKPADALARALRILQKDPRSIAGLDLAVEADLANHGAQAGLAQYEHWLAGRPVEEPGVLRRIARALLLEIALQQGDHAARVEALRGLAADGDPEAKRQIAAVVAQGTIPPGSRAALGDQNAVRALLAQLDLGGPGQVVTIDALGESRSPLAVPALVARLRDPRQEVRAAAAAALGKIGDADQVPQLAPLLSDTSLHVRVSAAGALLTLGDASGVTELETLMTDESATTRLMAAQALASHPDGSWSSVVRELASSEDPEVRAGAARLLAAQDPAFARAVLNDLANDDNPAIRELAALDLGEVVSSDLTELRGMLKSESLLTRAKAGAQVLAVTR